MCVAGGNNYRREQYELADVNYCKAQSTSKLSSRPTSYNKFDSTPASNNLHLEQIAL